MSAVARTEGPVQGPAWDLSAEYSGPEAAELEADLAQLGQRLDAIEALTPVLVALMDSAPALRLADAGAAIAAAREIHALREVAWPLLANPRTFASCLLSVNSRDEMAQALQGRLQGLEKRFGEAVQPHEQFLELVSDEVVNAYLADPSTASAEFVIRHARVRRHELLGLEEEGLANALAQDGLHAWGRLYTQLSGTLKCEVMVGNETRSMGLAEAANLLQKPDESVRRAAWQGINAAWTTQEEAAAASVNAIAGWRLEMCKRRSRVQPVHHLDAPAHASRISRATLDALMAAAHAARPLSRRAAVAMGRAYGKPTIGPWDSRAPAPLTGTGVESVIPFTQAIEHIAQAYAGVHADMGSFVRMMAKNGWIEGTVGPSKRPGAYCTGFAKSRTPRVYMTYAGAPTDVITLAHELGHAFHSWVMRDLPLTQRNYGMSLAETASTFGEATVRDRLLAQAGTPDEQLAIVWEEMAALTAFLLNIPARFEFEQRLYQARAARPLRPAELRTLMSEAWLEWYGDAIAEPDPMFWASKLHFHISGLSFYNFPYLFGYLFSMGVYLRRETMGDAFFEHYQALLRDTGRMTAEALARQHLQVVLDEPGFWNDTVARLGARVDAFEALVDQLGPAH